MSLRLAIILVGLTFTCFCNWVLADPTSRIVGKSVYVGRSDLSAAFAAYLNRIRPKILDNWDYPSGRNRVTLQSIVLNDGTVSDTNITSMPNNPVAEQAANTAFAHAQPLEPLPSPNVPRAKLTLIFESNYDLHGESTSNLLTRLEPVPNDNLKQ